MQSIGELRRALGDDGPRLIKTIPRRGYRFEAEVSAVAPPDKASAGTATDDVAGPSASSSDAARLAMPFALISPVRGLNNRLIGLFAALALAGLLAAAVLLWTGIATEWTHLSVRGFDRSAATGSPHAGALPAIAILPLANQGDDPGREYFADGLTQDIINALGRFSELTVMSWNAVFPHKGKPSTPQEIGRHLAVAYLVEGSVRLTGDRVRVTVQLVDTRDGRVLWTVRLDEALADVFAMQDSITAQIVGALAVRVTQIEQRRVLKKPTENLEAYDFVLRARPALQSPTRANNVEARTLLKRAIELDPNYAAAYAALGDTYHMAASMGWAESPSDFLDRAEALANKALKSRRFRGSRARHPGPHTSLSSKVQGGGGSDRTRHCDQSERCAQSCRSWHGPDVVRTGGYRDRGPGARPAHRSRTQCGRPLRAQPGVLSQRSI